MKLTEPLNYNGRLYEKGEIVTGHLPMELIAELHKNGKIEGGEPFEAAGLTREELTTDDFDKLSADEQKVLLESLGLVAATNKEGRSEQYTAWLTPAGDSDEL